MFKSIFTRLWITYLLIIVGAIGVISIALSIIYSNFLYEQQKNTLVNASSRINQLVGEYYLNNISNSELENSLNSIGYISGSKIYVLKLPSDFSKKPSNLPFVNEEFIYPGILDDLKNVMTDKTIFKKNIYPKKLETEVILLAVPLKLNYKIDGVILFLSPIEKINQSLSQIWFIIWILAAISIFLSTIITYFNSKKISKPIKEIVKASFEIAHGKNIDDIKVTTKDEIYSLAKSFNYMKFQIYNTDKIRKDFISNISHDLRTPLTSINGFISGMIDGIIKINDYPKYLTIIKDETQRLIKLTSELIEIAKFQSGDSNLNKINFNINDITQKIIDNLKVLNNTKNINYIINIPSSANITADYDKIYQILYNLIENAVKYNKENGFIDISLLESETEVKLSIKDSGIGISPDDLPFIFDKFYRADKSRNSFSSGSGIGLNIVKLLVKLHGGSLTVNSYENIGTEIILSFPK